MEVKTEWIPSLYVVRAKASEALERIELAVHWYKEALKEDVFCYEAFDALIARNMISDKDQDKLVDSLSDRQGDWIKALYKCLSGKVSSDLVGFGSKPPFVVLRRYREADQKSEDSQENILGVGAAEAQRSSKQVEERRISKKLVVSR